VGLDPFAAEGEPMKLQHDSVGKRHDDDRVVLMLERYVRDERGSAPIVLKQPALSTRLANTAA